MEMLADDRAAELPFGLGESPDLDAAFAAAPDGMLLIGESGRIGYVNAAAERLLGHSAASLVGRPADTLRGHPLGTELAGGQPFLVESESPEPSEPLARIRLFRRPDNAEQPLSVSSGSWSSGLGRRRIVILRDASDLVAEERRLHGEKARAEAANLAKTAFLARLSHELRTPLNAIVGFADMIREAVLGPIGNPRYQEYGGDIRQSADHLLQLINGLLDLSVIEQGTVSLREETFCPVEVAEEALRLVAPSAGRADVSLETLLPPLPPIRADRTKIRQVLVNFLANAIKFTPSGGRVDLRARLDADGGLELAVSDTGIGMTPEELARVGRPYVQGRGGASLPGEGVGLGLSLAKQLAELHGGETRLDSTYGEGTTAILRLPPDRVLAERQRAGGAARQ
jgi:two-component system cell cycle sensor histidine kinase PleC